MPLLYEINNDKQVLCFIPNGYNQDGRFADLHGHLGLNCWYEAQRRLAFLYSTQTPFNAQQMLLGLKDSHLPEITRMRMENYFEIEKICKERELAHVLMRIAKFILTRKNFNLEKVSADNSNFISQSLELFDEEQHKTVESLLKDPENIEQLKKHCKILQGFLNINPETEKLKLIAEYTEKLDLKILNQGFENSSLGYNLSQIFQIDQNSPHKHAQQIAGLNFIFAKLNDLQMVSANFTTVEECKKQIIEILHNHGPFMVHGYLGQLYYSQPPIFLEKLGSVDLFYFNKNSYTPKPTAHAVNVIGITNDRVIFLDPSCESNVDGPRQAFTISIASFMEKIKLSKNNEELLFAVNKNRVDTTPAMLEMVQLPQQSKSRHSHTL